MNVQSRKLVREITGLPSWSHSSVATDDENVLYVNTRRLPAATSSFIGKGILSRGARSRMCIAR